MTMSYICGSKAGGCCACSRLHCRDKPRAYSTAILRSRSIEAMKALSFRYTLERWILHRTTSIAKTRNRAVVRPSCELLLHSLGKHRTIDIRICWSFRGEFAVEVGSIFCVNLGLC